MIRSRFRHFVPAVVLLSAPPYPILTPATRAWGHETGGPPNGVLIAQIRDAFARQRWGGARSKRY
jgi:hypothetical protein